MTQLELIDSQGFVIASLKHTGREHEFITFWGRNHCGYTPVVGSYCGIYSAEDAAKLNDGYDCIAVRLEVVQTVLSPEPCFASSYAERGMAKFFDQIGPCVMNEASKWRVLIKDAKPATKPKPEYFRGTRRAIYRKPTL